MNYIDEVISEKKKKLPYALKWLIYSYKRIFRIFTIKQVGDRKVIIIPCYSEHKNIKKWIPRLCTILYDHNIDTIVLSKTMKKIDGITEEIHKENISILNGKILKENLLLKIAEYISNELHAELKDMDITLLVNENKKIHVENIIALAENTRNVKIVTNHLEDFKTLEQKLQEKFGILIRVTNNRRKGLANSGIIINIDFPEELVNKYTINTEAILVNLENSIKLKSKKFTGINAHDIKINFTENFNLEFAQSDIYNDFEVRELYEETINNKTFDEIQKKIKQDNVYITALIGNNGVIAEKEFEEKCKFYVKTIDKMSIFN